MTDARVARLTLTAPDDAHVRRGALLVEDAMRIATLAPDADRRAYIVRHLDVGTIDPEATSHTLALQIERRLAHVQLTAVPAHSADAMTARAVWFPDDIAATVELVRHLARGTTPREWFWPHVAAGAIKRPTIGEAIGACMRFAALQAAGPLAIAAVVDAGERERDGAVLGLLRPSDGADLVRATLGVAPSLGLPIVRTEVLATITPVWRARLARWIPAWGADARSLWLAAIAAISSRSSLRAPATELAHAGRLVAAALVEAATVLDGAATTRPSATGAPASRVTAGVRSSPHVQEPVRTRSEERSSTGAPLIAEATLLTHAAGALFLVRPLAMLGIGDWLAEHAWTAAQNWPAQLLAAIAAEHAGPDDPLAIALADAPPADGPFVAPARWRALVGHRPHRLRPTTQGGRVLEAFAGLPLAAWATEQLPLDVWRTHSIRRGPLASSRAWAAHAWRRVLARWLRTFTPLSLVDLVGRTGTIESTPTHIDVVFPLRTADVRIRAAGLDLDPGWVPWLGRVVRFHYREDSR